MTNDASQSRMPDPADERSLFDAYRAAFPDPSQDVDLQDVAAWLDEQLEPDAANALEAAMSRDPHARQLASTQRLDGALTPDVITDELLNTLHELQPGRSTSLKFETSSARSNTRAWWASTAAAAGIVVAIAGFLGGRIAATESYSSEDRFLATATFNVFDDEATTSEFDVLMFDLARDMEIEQ